MESCIAGDGGRARAARARRADEPAALPDARRPGPTAMGLMPVPRGRRRARLRAEGDRRRAANSASGLDPHQGSVLLHDGDTGQLIAILNASPITEIRTAAVSGVATKLLARPGLAHGRRPRLRRAGTLARRRDADGARRSDHPDLEPEPATTPRRSRSRRTRSSPARSRRRSTAPTSSAPPRRRASPSSSSTGSRRARTSTPPARSRTASPASSAPDTVAAVAILRRPARVDAQRVGDYLLRGRGAAASAPSTSSAELGELLERHARGPPLATTS